MAAIYSNPLNLFNLTSKGTPTTSDLVPLGDAAVAGVPLKQATVGSLPFVQLAGSTMTGLLTLSGDPSTALQAVTKQYADNIAGGNNYKDTVIAASTAALTVTYSNGAAGVGATLTNAGTQVTFALDGQSPSVGQRVLIKNQASTFQNGIYSVTNVGSGSTNWVLTRTLDYNTAAQIKPGDLIPTENGTTNANTLWLQTATVATMGTDPITFQQFSSAPLTLPLSLANGGTNASLAANNGGIFYSTASAGALLAGTATARQMLQSGATGAPAWSTATYPATTTVSQILYSSATNVVGGITTANSAVLVTDSSGVPTMSGTMTNGQLIIGNTSGTPTAATLTAGSNVTITNGAHTITIAQSAGGSGALTWIASVTAASSATVDFSNDLSSTYDNYVVIGENIVAGSSTAYLTARFGTGGTPTYQATNYTGRSVYANSYYAPNGSAAGTTYMDVTANTPQLPSTSTSSAAINVTISNANDGTNYKNLYGNTAYQDSSNRMTCGSMGWQWQGATALTSIRFLMSSGNIATGIFKLYGVQN